MTEREGYEDQLWRDEKLLRHLYVKKGLSTATIGEKLGCDRKTVNNWLNEYGITKPWKDPETLQELRSQGLTLNEIATELKASQATISKWMNRFDLDTSYLYEKQPWHDEQTLRELYINQELSIADVADELNCSSSAVTEWLDRHDIPTRPRNDPPPDELQNPDKLRELYWDRGLSTYKIAERVDRVPSKVYDWLKRHNIETRSVGSQPGELHHRWKGGREPYYGRNWHKQRRHVRERDQYRCQHCGQTEGEHLREYGSELHVHHVVPLRKFTEPADANQMDNLITLCFQCHNSAENYDNDC